MTRYSSLNDRDNGKKQSKHELNKKVDTVLWVLTRCLENFLGSLVPGVQPFPCQAEQHALQGGILTSAALPRCCVSHLMSDPAHSAFASTKATAAKENLR